LPDRLSDVVPNACPIFVPRLIGQHPELAALVADTISTWSYAEHAIGRSVATMSRGINSAEMEGYISNWRLPSRMKIVSRLARVELTEPYRASFLKTLKIVADLAKERHAFAHGIWGAIEALPNALLLVDPEHILRHWGAANDWIANFFERGSDSAGPVVPLDNKHIEVWSDVELKGEVDRMNKAFDLSLMLEGIASDDPFDKSNLKRDHIHGLLLAHPLFNA
jgi:hypothetical protein